MKTETGKQRTKISWLLILPALFLNVAQVVAQPVDDVRLHIPAILLLDESGTNVLVSGKPYSSKMSCGTAGCHDYDTITHAFHIEQGRDEARDDFGKLRGVPQLVGPGYFGGYNCMTGNNPQQLAKKNNASVDDFSDLGAAGWVQRCASCHSGGGWMEKDRNGRRYDEVDRATVTALDGDYYNRGTDENNQPASLDTVAQWDWQKSGVVENDCLICHVDFKALKSFGDQPIVLSHGNPVTDSLSLFKSVRVNELIKKGFFRYTNSALLGYINLNLTTDETLDKAILNGFQRDTNAENILQLDNEGLPQLNWNAAAFTDSKVEIPMLRFPSNDNCMMCHRTGNSRRGFYGFGEGAEATYDEDDVLIEDYRDDVHKGKLWTEANSQERAIENCNACHARNYYNDPASTNVDPDASHNFLKGNSDMDVRNDLDFAPNAKSCEYCHNDAEKPSIPSGHDDMLSAHRELWKAKGDMFGYPLDTLTRITQTHLDVVSCQTCHITGKKYQGKPLKLSYRYRAAEDGKLKITPYKFKARYYWQDKNSGRVLNATERDSVFRLAPDNSYGEIIDPVSGAVLGKVGTRFSHGSWRFSDPSSYSGFLALKHAYDKLLIKKGVAKPDMALIWAEPNAYLISHNTSPAVSSLQCADCHNQKQGGSFSSLVSPDGLLGETNINVITQLPDRRLVDEGIVVLDLPFMKMDDTGKVTENVSDILYATRLDPSMTILKSATASVATGLWQCIPTSTAIKQANVSIAEAKDLEALFADSMASNSEACSELESPPAVFLFQPNHGNEAVRAVSMMSEVNGQTGLLFPSYRLQVALAGEAVKTGANEAGLGGLVAEVFSLEARDKNAAPVNNFAGNRILVKLPYTGSNTNTDEIKVIYSSDGKNWSAVNSDDIVLLQPQSEETNGYIAFWVEHFSHYTVVDKTVATEASQNDNPAETAGSGSGGCTLRRHTPFDPLLPMLVAISSVYLWRRRVVR